MRQNRDSEIIASFITSKIEVLKKKNPRVSLRALSQKAGISSGRFSEILKGKRKLSPYYAEKIAHALKLSQQERNYLFTLAPASARKKPSLRVLHEQEVAFVTAWENYAILSLMKTADFQPECLWISQRLDISQARIEKCLNLMISLGLIRKTTAGLVRASESIQTVTDIPSRYLRQAHRSEIDKALNVLETTSVNIRSFTSATMAINPKKIISAKKMIQEFQERLARHLEQGEKTEVYNLNIQLFPLTKTQEPS